MSDKSLSLDSLERNQRSLKRQINATKGVINSAFHENPSDEVAFRIGAHLDELKTYLMKLEDVVNDIIEITDFTGKSTNQIAEAEAALSKEVIQLNNEYATSKGKLSAMFARLKKPSEQLAQSRRSLDTSFNADSSIGHALVKLPDIPVPKFDGKMKNFTEWHSLFSAMIDKNDSLKPVQKLYFLKQAMVGDASTLLKDHTLQEGAYETAFKYVEERYYNRRALIATHFHDLLELPTVTMSSLRETLDRVNAIIRGLKVCQLDVEKMSPLIAFILVRKLPERLRTDWENSHLDYSSYPSFEPLGAFLQNRCFAFESLHPDSSKEAEAKKTSPTEDKKKPKATLALATKQKSAPFSSAGPKCLLCEKGHFLSQCEEFLEKSVADRFSLVREKRLCTNCLRQYHTASVCNSSKCKRCGDPHHSLLHREINPNHSNPKKSESVELPREESSKTALTSAATVLSCTREIVLLPSAVVLVEVGSRWIKARVLIDPCSQLNLVSEAFVRWHRYATKAALAAVQSVSPEHYYTARAVTLRVKSRYNSYEIEFEASVVGTVPYQIGSAMIKRVEDFDPELRLAECVLPYTTVDILIGGQFANQILSGEKKFFGEFSLQNSTFGWVTEGPLNSFARIPSQCCNLTVDVESELLRFFEAEEVYPPKPVLSTQERCEEHFLSTYARLADGKFQIRLPRDKPIRDLANTYAQARAALLRFERQLDHSTREMYVEFMREYRALGHMKLATNFQTPRYFIPHLFVLRPDSSSTKFRAVFNASAKNCTGISLNEALMIGPVLQPDIFEIILRFRTYPIAFSADISKMYRQIQVHPDDWALQSILWREEPNLPIQIFELTTVTYGTAPASYIATKCLQLIANQLESINPEAAYAIGSEFYMDDLLSGACNVDAAIAKQQAIHAALEEAHFPLRKYVSNSPQFLSSLNKELLEPLKPVEFAPTGAAKLLGLQWEPAHDWFSIRTNIIPLDEVIFTKRAVASLTAQAFDPTGFVAPVVIRAKILLQDLWREGKSWDEPISPEIARAFKDYYQDIVSLSSVTIPRFYGTHRDSATTLIGFCDASPRAYGAAVYLSVVQNHQRESILVCAKSKVAPLKMLTIPRLELLGAVLLTKLLVRIRNQRTRVWR